MPYCPQTLFFSQPLTFPLSFFLQTPTHHRSTFCLGGIMRPRRTRLEQEQEEQEQQQQQGEKEELGCRTRHQQQQQQQQRHARGGSRSDGGGKQGVGMAPFVGAWTWMDQGERCARKTK